MDANTIALGTLALAGVGTVLAMLRYVQASAEKAADTAGKALHSAQNHWQVTFGRLDQDVTELQRTSARRDDLARLETKIDALPDRMDVKIDAAFRRMEGSR